MSSYAKKYSMDVLMSNFSGQSWGRNSGGRSAFLTKNGILLAEMDASCSGLLLVEKKIDSWTAQVLKDE